MPFDQFDSSFTNPLELRYAEQINFETGTTFFWELFNPGSTAKRLPSTEEMAPEPDSDIKKEPTPKEREWHLKVKEAGGFDETDDKKSWRNQYNREMVALILEVTGKETLDVLMSEHQYSDSIHQQGPGNGQDEQALLMRKFLQANDSSARQKVLEDIASLAVNGGDLHYLAPLMKTLTLVDATSRLRKATNPDSQKEALRSLAKLELDAEQARARDTILTSFPSTTTIKAGPTISGEKKSDGVADRKLMVAEVQQEVKDEQAGGVLTRHRLLVQSIKGTEEQRADAIKQLESSHARDCILTQPPSNSAGTYMVLTGLKKAHAYNELGRIADAQNPAQARDGLKKLLALSERHNDTAIDIIEKITDKQKLLEELSASDPVAQQKAMIRLKAAVSNPDQARRKLMDSPTAILEEFAQHNKELVEQARQTILDLQKKNLDKADVHLERFLDRAGSSQQRREALDGFKRQAEVRFRSLHSSSFVPILQTMRAADAMLSLKEITGQCLRSKELVSVTTVGARLTEILNEAKENPEYLKYIDALGGAANVEKLIKDLANPTSRHEALERLNKNLLSPEKDLDELRIGRIVHRVPNFNDSNVLDKAFIELKKETENGNVGAREWLQWVEVGRELSTMNTGSLKDVSAAAGRLIELDKAGNPNAKAALASTLMGSTDKTTIENWYRKELNLSANKPLFVPDLSRFRNEKDLIELTELKTSIVGHFNSTIESEATKALSRSEALAVVTILAEAVRIQPSLKDGSSSKESIARLTPAATKLLSGAVAHTTVDSRTGQQVESETSRSVMTALNDLIVSDRAGREVLADIYMAGAKNREFAFLHKYIEQKALSGDKLSIKIIAASNGGISGDEYLARSAMNVLEQISQTGAHRGLVIDSLRDAFSKSGDTAHLLETLGRLAGQEGKIYRVNFLFKTALERRDPSQELKAKVAKLIPGYDPASGDFNEATARLPEADYNAVFSELSDPRTTSSALKGLMNLAENWDSETGRIVASHISPELIARMAPVADKIPSAVRHEIIESLMRQFGERTAYDKIVKLTDASAAVKRDCLEGLALFAKYLSREQVEALASYGGDHNYNRVVQDVRKVLNRLELGMDAKRAIEDALANKQDLSKTFTDHGVNQEYRKLIIEALQGSNSGIEKISRLGFEGEAAKQLQAGVAKVLLSVLAKAPNSQNSITGPRQAAFTAFRDLQWNIPTGELNQDGTYKLISSHESNSLRDALLNYYDNSPFDLKLADQINRIIEHAKLPISEAAIIYNSGLHGVQQGKPNPLGLETVFEITNRIVAQYTSEKEDGKDVVRRVIANIQLVNTLPGSQRARLMGWNNLPDALKDLLGRREPTAEQKKKLEWDKLSKEQQDDIAWAAATVDSADVFRQMRNGVLRQSTHHKEEPSHWNDALLRNLKAEVTESYIQAVEKEGESLKQINDISIKRDRELKAFSTLTKKGVSTRSKFANIFNNAVDEEFSYSQVCGINAFTQSGKEIEDAQTRQSALNQKAQSLKLALSASELTRLRNQGQQVAADELLMDLWRTHQANLSVLSETAWSDLTRSTDNTIQGASTLKRLTGGVRAHWDLVPGYALDSNNSVTKGSDGTTYFRQGKPFTKGLQQALGLLPAENAGEARGLAQLRRSPELIDKDALRSYIFSRVNQDPVLKKFSDAARAMNTDLNELSTMFSAAIDGDVYDPTIAIMRMKSLKISQVMSRVEEVDLHLMEERISLMEKALEQMKQSRDYDDTTSRQLRDQIDSYKNMHNMFNRFEKQPRYPDVINYGRDSKGELIIPRDRDGNEITPNQQITQMLTRILDGGLKASTFTNWFKENGLLIVTTVAACAATVAACATFGVTSPLAVGLWCAVAGLAAREITNEVLYHVNQDGYSGWGHYDNNGARCGDYVRRLERGVFKTDREAAGAFFKEVLGPYAFEVGRDWLAFVATAGIVSKTFGGNPAALTPVQAAYRAERAALIAEGTNGEVAKSFMRQFLGHLSRELTLNTAFTSIHVAAEAHLLSPAARRELGEHGQFLVSFALATTMAMVAGGSYALLRSAGWSSGGVFRFKLNTGVSESSFINLMKAQGFIVEQAGRGRWKVLPVGGPANMPAITMENMERGLGTSAPRIKEAFELQNRPDQPSEVKVKDAVEEVVWTKPSDELPAIRLIDDFSLLFAENKFKEAYEVACLTKPADGKTYRSRTYKPTQQGDPDLTVVSHERLRPLQLEVERKQRALDRIIESTEEVTTPGGKEDKVFNAAKDLDIAQLDLDAQMQVILYDLSHPSVSNFSEVTVGKFVAMTPRLKINIKGFDFDLISGATSRSTKQAFREAEQAFKLFRESKEAERLLMEQSINAMEEHYHMAVHASGNKINSPTYAEFVRDTMSETTRVSLLKDLKSRGKDSIEQEFIFTLFDRGWSISQIELHFGTRHQAYRIPAIDYLKGRQALDLIPDAKMRAELRALISDPALTPMQRTIFMKELPVLAERHRGPGELLQIARRLHESGALKGLECLQLLKGKPLNQLKNPFPGADSIEYLRQRLLAGADKDHVMMLAEIFELAAVQLKMTITRQQIAVLDRFNSNQLKHINLDVLRTMNTTTSQGNFVGLKNSAEEMFLALVIVHNPGIPTRSHMDRLVLVEQSRQLRALCMVEPGTDLSALAKDCTKPSAVILQRLRDSARNSKDPQINQVADRLEAWAALLEVSPAKAPLLNRIAVIESIATGDVSSFLYDALAREPMTRLSQQPNGAKHLAEIFGALLQGTKSTDGYALTFCRKRIAELNSEPDSVLLNGNVVSHMKPADLYALKDYSLNLLGIQMERSPCFAKWVKDTIGFADLYAESPNTSYVSAHVLAQIFRRAHNVDNTTYDGRLYRGEAELRAIQSGDGIKKAFLDRDNNLHAPNAAGAKALEDHIIDHLDACRGGETKQDSPFVSASTFPDVLRHTPELKYGGKLVAIDVQSLRAAIAKGEVKDAKILEAPDLVEAIQKAKISDERKKQLTAACLSGDEVLIMGNVPSRFIQIIK